jgi:hypothetical protein
LSKKDFFKRELTENPEFFNAFPHLRSEADVMKEKMVEQGIITNDEIP